ncbi:MAG: hypothetical protein NTU86_14315 [Burkholderiales bacterium]|nr:hypothetical protein [Burkholderiales bacterium]
MPIVTASVSFVIANVSFVIANEVKQSMQAQSHGSPRPDGLAMTRIGVGFQFREVTAQGQKFACLAKEGLARSDT